LIKVYPHHIAALNNKEHMRFSDARYRNHDQASQTVYLKIAGPDCVLLDLLDRRNGQSVGSMSCYLDHLNGVVDMGLMIVPEYCGHRFGREAWETVMRYWLTDGHMDKIEAGMMAANTAMANVCMATHMKYEGCRRYHFRFGTERLDLVMYGKTRK
jgi:RimJ/RimL family protein N-acetyltransferase